MLLYLSLVTTHQLLPSMLLSALQAMTSLSLTTCQFHIDANACCCCCCHTSIQYSAVSGVSSIDQLVANPAQQCHLNNNVFLNHPLNVAHPAQFTLHACTACRYTVRYTACCGASPVICCVWKMEGCSVS